MLEKKIYRDKMNMKLTLTSSSTARTKRRFFPFLFSVKINWTIAENNSTLFATINFDRTRRNPELIARNIFLFSFFSRQSARGGKVYFELSSVLVSSCLWFQKKSVCDPQRNKKLLFLWLQSPPPVARRKRPKLRARIIVIIWTYLRQAFFFVGHLTRQKQQWEKRNFFCLDLASLRATARGKLRERQFKSSWWWLELARPPGKYSVRHNEWQCTQPFLVSYLSISKTVVRCHSLRRALSFLLLSPVRKNGSQ